MNGNVVIFLNLLSVLCLIMSTQPVCSGSNNRNLIKYGGFEGGLQAVKDAGWTLDSSTEILTDKYSSSGKSYITVKGDGGSAVLKWIDVKPGTGYMAKCLISVNGGGHLTLGIIDKNGKLFVCRDVYVSGPQGKWSELVLPFRSEDNSRIGISLGKRYGSAVCFDKIELYEDNSVQIGDVSPKPRYPFPKLTDTEKSRGYIVSQTDCTEIVYPTYYPSRSKVIKKLECGLTPDEREPVLLLVSAYRPLSSVQVALAGDLISKEGGVIPSGNVDIRMVRTMERWLSNSEPLKPGQRYERRPLFLFPNSKVNISENESQQFWLTVHAPLDATAGVYTTAVRITADNSPEYSIPLNVRVLPIKLSEPEITYGMYYRPHEQYPEYINSETIARDMRDMSEHGMNSISIYAMIERRDTFAVDFDFQPSPQRYSLNYLMQLAKDAGLLNRKHPILYLPEDYQEYMYMGKEKTVQAVKEHEKQMGWPELLFYIGDEPADSNAPGLKKITSVIHNVPNARTVTAGVRPGPLGDIYDVWISSVYEPALSKVSAQARKQGKECWIYECVAGGAIPVNERYIVGLLPWSSGVRGVWQWCYSEPTNGGQVDESGKIEFQYPYYEGPWSINYILRSKDENIPTLGWELRREGLDDYRYILTLEKLIATAEQSENRHNEKLVNEAKTYLKNLARKAKRDILVHSIAHVDNGFVKEYNPKLKASDYAGIRKKVIGYILKLQK